MEYYKWKRDRESDGILQMSDDNSPTGFRIEKKKIEFQDITVRRRLCAGGPKQAFDDALDGNRDEFWTTKYKIESEIRWYLVYQGKDVGYDSHLRGAKDIGDLAQSMIDTDEVRSSEVDRKFVLNIVRERGREPDV